VDDSTFPAVLDDLQHEVVALAAWLRDTPDRDLATAEMTTLARLREVGGRLLEAGLATRGTGGVSGISCGCGQRMRFEGYRPKAVQTLVGWITRPRA
jgi:hypothetical protein